MIENYQNSLKKWDEGLWDRLTESTVVDRNGKWWIEVWNACGFCLEFICKTSCPLYEDHICNKHWESIPETSILITIYDAWIEDDKEKFEVARLKFVKEIKKHKSKFRT